MRGPKEPLNQRVAGCVSLIRPTFGTFCDTLGRRYAWCFPMGTSRGAYMVRFLLSNSDFDINFWYTRSMNPHNQAVDSLCQLLSTGDEADRCYAARTLGALGTPVALESLVERLRDEDIDVCVDAAEALGAIGDAAALPHLLESLANETSGEICTAVVGALSSIGDKKALEALRKVVAERPPGLEWEGDWDTWWDVQLEAVRALARQGDEQAVGVLVAILDDENQQDIEEEILKALAQIEGAGVQALVDRLQGGSPRSRRRAVRALGFTQAAEATRTLGRTLQDPEAEVRAAAALALAEQGAQRYLRAVLLLLRDQDDGVRTAAIEACGTLADKAGASSELYGDLLPLLEDPSAQVRSNVFETLARVLSPGGLAPEGLACVIASLDEQDMRLVTAACALLGSQRAADAVPELMRVMQDDGRHAMQRREATLALGRIGVADATVIDALTNAISDREQAVRLAALTAMAELQPGAPEQVEGEAPAPMDILIAAVLGKLGAAPEKDDRAGEDEVQEIGDETPPESRQEQVIRLDPERTLHSQADHEAPATPQTTETAQEATAVNLPDIPARIVAKGEVRSAASTLDAIAMDNVEVALELDDAREEKTPPDEETQHLLDIVAENERVAQRLFPSRKIDVRLDVRRLGARVLANSSTPRAVTTLIAALHDEDAELRREAAGSLGEIARNAPETPGLSDALGSLLTQLAMDEPEQKIACARALGHLGNRAALLPLLDSLHDASSHVRIEAIRALARLAVTGRDPIQADHMVVRDIPSLTLARRVGSCLEDSESGVRLEAARALSELLDTHEARAYTNEAVEKVIAAGFEGAGQQARRMGRALRRIDIPLSAEKLLTRLGNAADSGERRFVIEMLEELFKPQSGQPRQAA